MDQEIGHKTISEAIGADHQYMDLCGEQLKNAKTHQEQINWRNQLTWTFARHAISEELTMYPAMERVLGAAGKEMTDTDLKQHQAVSDTLSTSGSSTAQRLMKPRGCCKDEKLMLMVSR